MAVRLALGANRGRVLRQFLTENLLVAFAGGLGGLAVAPWSVRALLALSPASLPLLGRAGVDLRVLAFTFLVAAGAGVAAGIAPAMRASKLNLSLAVREGSRSVSLSRGHRRLRHGLVVGEVALSVLLLAGAILLATSLIHLERVNPGFNPQNVWTFHLALPPERFKSSASAWTFEQQVLQNLGTLPGVKSAGVVSSLPLVEFGLNGGVRVKSGDKESRFFVQFRAASPSYFAAMQIPLVRGQEFGKADTAASPLVVLVNQAFARACCQGDAVGSQVYLNEGFRADGGREVVGIVGDNKERDDGMAGPAPPIVFIPEAQLNDNLFQEIHLSSASSWVIRSQAPLSLDEVRGAVAAVDPTEAVADFASMSALVNESIAPNLFVATLSLIFAGVAVCLAAVGLYGVLSHSVAERTHEIGVRMALGAERRSVLKLVLVQGLSVTLMGAGIGLASALALTRLLRDLLFGVRPTDPLTFTLALATIVGVSMAASFIPVRRATKVDPMVALRYE